MRTIERKGLSLIGLTCAAVGLATLAPAQPPNIVQKVEVGFIQRVEIAPTLEFTGSLEASQTIQISAKAQAQLIALPVEEGQRVEKGDLLFELDARAEEIALERAQAELEKAKTELEKLEAGYLPDEIEDARRAVEAAKSRLEAAKEDWERIEPLAKQDIVTATDATGARLAFEVAQSELVQTQSRLNLLEQGFRNEEVRVAAAEVKARQAAVDDIRRRLADHRQTADVGGVIVQRLKEQGEWMREGEPVLVMVVLDPMKVRLSAPQAQLTSITQGQAAQILIDGLENQKFSGEVTAVIPQAQEGTRNFPVLMRVDNPEGKLAAGMFTRVEIAVGKEVPALVVPREAVRNLGDRLVIYRVDPLPAGFVWEPPNFGAGPGGPPKGGPGGKPPTIFPPDGRVHEVTVKIVREFEREVAIDARLTGEIKEGTEIVIFGHSRLGEGTLIHRLNPSLPGAG